MTKVDKGVSARKLARALRLSRRAMLTGAAAAAGLAVSWKGPFISDAAAATPTLRPLSVALRRPGRTTMSDRDTTPRRCWVGGQPRV